MTRNQLIALAGAGSAAMLLAAFGYQYIGGYLPCAMCLWQRWPHAVAIVAAVMAIPLKENLLIVSGALAMFVNAGLGAFHTGVERGWWEGPSTCASSAAQDLGAMTGSDLLDFTTGPQIVLCNEAALHILGLSMASWNALGSLALFALWWAAARRADTAQPQT